MPVNSLQIDKAVHLLRDAERTLFFTGAGMSTESGLPDYRGPNGVWTTGKIPVGRQEPVTDDDRLAHWQRQRNRYPFMQSRRPNEGHYAIAKLMGHGYGFAVVTQNIDGLHQMSGIPADRVMELHGSSRRMRCLPNGHIVSSDAVQAELEQGVLDPRCPICGGELRSDTVLFGEALPQAALTTAAKAAALCDLMIIVGSSLVVYPAARLPQIAHDRGARIIIIDRAETALDHIADLVIRGEAGTILTTIADRLLKESSHDVLD